jgi:hypothetical protein
MASIYYQIPFGKGFSLIAVHKGKELIACEGLSGRMDRSVHCEKRKKEEGKKKERRGKERRG